MKKIANIVYKDNLVNHTKVDYVNYIQENQEFENLQPKLPTLYVGWKFLKAVNPKSELIQNHSILEKRIFSHTLYWEYSFDENKSDHVSGVELFTLEAPYYYFSNTYRYTNIDPVFFNVSGLTDLIALIPLEIDYYYKYKDEMLYVLSGSNIIGLDLKMYDFFNFNIDDIIEKVKSRSVDGMLDPEGEVFQEYYKSYPNFEYLRRYLITLLSK